VFRFFDAATGAHFLTSSAVERDHVIATLTTWLKRSRLHEVGSA